MKKNTKKDDESGVVAACANALTQNPLPVLLITIFTCLLMCIGYAEYNVIKDVSKLWIQDGSVVGDEIEYWDDHTYDKDKTTTNLMTTVRYPDIGDDVMNAYTLTKHYEAALRISQVEVTYSGYTYGYNDVCSTTNPYVVQCTRVTVLDCFKEGGYDFPAVNGLATLDGLLAGVRPLYASNVRSFVVSGVEEKFWASSNALKGAVLLNSLNFTSPILGLDMSDYDFTIDFCAATAESKYAASVLALMQTFTGLGQSVAASKAIIQSYGTYGSETWRTAMIGLWFPTSAVSSVESTYKPNVATNATNYNDWLNFWIWIGAENTIDSLIGGFETAMLSNPTVLGLYSSLGNALCGNVDATQNTTVMSDYRQCVARIGIVATLDSSQFSSAGTASAYLTAATGLSFTATTYAGAIETETYKAVVVNSVASVSTSATYTLSGRNIDIRTFTNLGTDQTQIDTWVRWFADNGCPSFNAPTTCSSGGTVEFCQHYDQLEGSTKHNITSQECKNSLIGVLQNTAVPTHYGIIALVMGVYSGTLQAPPISAFMASHETTVLIPTVTSVTTTCLNDYDSTATSGTNYTRGLSLCALNRTGGVLAGELDAPDAYFTSSAGWNDTAYYLALTHGILKYYGLGTLYDNVTYTNNFPFALWLKEYFRISYNIASLTNSSNYPCRTVPFTSTTFTTVAGFYTEFIDATCPTVAFKLNGSLYCSLNTACACPANEFGATPYSARPSFKTMTDAQIAQQISKTCYYWDGGIAYPPIPTQLVLGRPQPENLDQTNVANGQYFTHVNGYEFVLYNLDKWAFVDKVATRPNDKVTITVDEADIILDLWMDGFMAAAPEKKESDSSSSDQKGVMTNSYAAKTFNDILDDASDNAYPLLITGLFLIFLYAFVTTGLTLLSLGGVSLVLLGTISGIGLSLGFGVSLNATTINVLPFLMLGLGVDDMFIFLRTLMQIRERADVKKMSPEDQVALVLRESGPCVCLTTFTNFCAFMIGTLTPLPVVQQFAMTAGITVIVSWFTNLVGFNALCVLSLKYTPNISISKALCGSGSTFSFATWSKNIVETKISPFLTNNVVRVVTIVFFVGIWGLSGYGISEIEMGLSVSEICKDGTQTKDFISVRDSYFAFYSTEVAAYAGVKWHEPAVQTEYLRVESEVYDVTYNLYRVDSWLKQFLAWCGTGCNSVTNPLINECGAAFGCVVNSAGYFDSGETAFYICLNEWYQHTTVTSVPSFYPLTTTAAGRRLVTNPIEFVEFPLYSQKMWKTDDFVDMIDATRKVIDDSTLNLFPLGISFTFWEQYRNLKSLLIQNVGVAVVCTFTIGSVSIYIATINKNAPVHEKLLKSAHGSIIMCIAMVSTMLSLMGFMGLADIWLSAIPALTVIAAMGICVDLTALLTLFFCVSSGTRDERIKKALVTVFVPTVDSMLSTIFGCVALAGSDVSLYVKFFFWMYFSVAVLGCLNGLLLLPVLLAWLGPSDFEGNSRDSAKVSDVFSTSEKHTTNDPVHKL